MRDYTVGLRKDELEDGAYYEGICRNAPEARWNAEHNEFVHWREKFGHRFLEAIKHPDDEQHYDVFNAAKKTETPKFPFEWSQYYKEKTCS